MSSSTTFFSDVREGANQGLEFFEESLRWAGYMPYVSTVTGGIRVAYGFLEIVTALALAALYRDRHYLEYGVHGVANVSRGLIESQRWVNLICIVWDQFVKRFTYTERIRWIAN